MLLRRFSFFLTLLALFVCWVVTEYTFFAAFMLALLLIALSSIAIFFLASGNISASIMLPNNCQKHADIPVDIYIHGNPLIYACELHPSGHITNLLTGETYSMDQVTFTPDKKGAKVSFQMNSPRCGKLSVELDSLTITDPFGLVQRKKPLFTASSATILPDTFRIAVELQSPDMPDIESDDYSSTRAGDDPSELFGIRDYRQGDPLKSVHWKLSEKYDRTVIREMSLPIAHQILLLLDNCPYEDPDIDSSSNMVESLISLSQSLLDESIPHQVGWLDRETEILEIFTVSSPEDLYALQDPLLSARVMKKESGLIAELLDQKSIEFSHILIFAGMYPEGIELLTNATLLVPEANPAEGISCLKENFETIFI